MEEALAVRAERSDALPITGGTDVMVELTFYGVRGVGEPPTISSGPAVAAAVRAACGKPLRQVPIRPEHITGT